jgi:hypothetical protein
MGRSPDPLIVRPEQPRDSRQLRTFTSSAAMYKYTARLTVHWAIPGLLRAASDTKRSRDNRARSRRYLKPISGVFAVTAAGPGLRRGHVIYSGVFAVAAVTAAGVPCLVRSLACPASSAEAPRAHWSASRRRPVLPDSGWPALEPGELGVPDDRRAPGRPGATMSSGSAAGRHPGGGRACHRAGTEAPGQRLGIVPRRDHRRRPGRPQAWPSAGAPCWIRARRTAMTSAITSSGSLRR